MTDRKKTTLRALEAFVDKQNKKDKPTRRNNSPEQDFAKQIIPFLKDFGFLVVRVESKAVFSASLGRYMNSQAAPGTPDIIACSPCGKFCAIELKAAGRRSTLKSHQREFLMHTIQLGGFACVTDSIEHFLGLWKAWIKSPSNSLLVADLPKAPSGANTDQPLFD